VSAHVEGVGDKTITGAKSEEITKRRLRSHEAKVEQRKFMRSKRNLPTRGVA